METTDIILGLFAQVDMEEKSSLDQIKKLKKIIYNFTVWKKNKNILIEELSSENVLYSVIEIFWPRQLTTIFDSSDIRAPEKLIIGQKTLAIDLTMHQSIRLILEELKMVFSTSANLAREAVPLKVEDIDL